MQIGMIGLGRMGGNMVSRLLSADHDCMVFDLDQAAVGAAEREGATAAASLDALVASLEPPRVVWIMIPATRVDALLAELAPLLGKGDLVVDGGNSHYRDAISRARALGREGIELLDVGVSGGIWGRELGYCQMIGGSSATVARLRPVFEALANGASARSSWLHCGPSGAGHFVKMVHNGIEYGLMQSYAEGFNLLKHGAALLKPDAGDANASTGAPPVELDVAAIAELWRHGSVVRSWLLDLMAKALARDPELGGFEGAVADSGEGRWTLEAAIAQGVPTPALAAALFARFSSRGGEIFADRLLSAMRKGFGGHVEPR